MRRYSALGKRLLHGSALATTGWLLLATSAEPVPNRECFADLGDEVALQITLGDRYVSGVDVGGSGATSTTAHQAGAAGHTSAAAQAGTSASGGNANVGNASSLTAGNANVGAAASLTAGSANVGAAASLTAGAAGTALTSSTGSTQPTVPISCNALDTLAPGKALDLALEAGYGVGGYGHQCIGYWTRSVDGIAGLELDDQLDVRLDRETAITALSGEFTLPSDPACRGHWSAVLRPIALDVSERPSPLDADRERVWLFERRLVIEQAQFCGVFSTRGVLDCLDSFTIEHAEDVSQ